MVRPIPHQITDHIQSIYLAVSLFVSIFALLALCAKRATKRASPKMQENDLYEVKSSSSSPIRVPKSPLSNPKKLLTSISNLTTNFNKKSTGEEEEGRNYSVGGDIDNGGFGEGGLWQKNIMMGEKCQPLEFSGVIYYDNYGKRVSDIPRSPRPSVAGLHSSYSFPVSSHSS